MKTRYGMVLAAGVALGIGATAGWFAAGAWGNCGNVELCNCGNVETANDGRARSPVSPSRRLSAKRMPWQVCAPKEKAKPRRKALIRSSADAEVQKRILENKISYLEKCISAAKRGGSAPPAEKSSETKAELIERLMKLPSDDERYLAFARLDEKTQGSFTISELRKLCPRQMTIDGLEEEFAERLERMTDVAARRIGVLDTLDQSGLNDDERKVHAEFMERLAEWPDVFADMIDQPDSMTFGEVVERINKAIAHQKRLGELVKDEREMLVEQVIKGFAVPEGDAGELRAVLDDVLDATSTGYFEEKD